MSNRVGLAAFVCVLLVGSVWVVSRRLPEQERTGPVLAGSNLAAPLSGALARATTVTTAKGVIDPQHLARFERDIAPVLNAFLTRLGALSAEGVVPPVHGPITADRLSTLKFIGGASNTVSTFIVDGRHVFHCQAVQRQGMERKGITSFWNVGKDQDGMPLQLGQLTEDPLNNADTIRRLADTNIFPAHSLEALASVAQRVLAAIGPPDHDRYPLKERWREQAGATALPFYTFIFLRQGTLSDDPSNVFRDEVMIRLKSTANGLVLDHYQDNSIVFAATTPQ